MLSRVCAVVTSLMVIGIAAAAYPQQAAQSASRPATTAAAQEQRRPEYPTVYVTDLHCQHCAKRLARKLFTVPGVLKVRANVKQDIAIVVPQKNKSVSPLALWEAAEAAKFEVVKIETPEETIDKKPVEVAENEAKRSPAAAQR